ncbi:MAG: AraC family transcriptional regulator [Bacteroidota bacterium]
MKSTIASQAYGRYKFVVTFISFFLIVQIISLLIVRFVLRTEQEILLDFLVDFSARGSFLALAIFESGELKKYFLKEKILKKEISHSKESKIQELIQRNFADLKLFKLNSFDLRELLYENKISEKDFTLFIKENYGLSTTAYVNKLRIEEFISLSSKGLTEKFDVVGLAHLCGFKSKTTFYRVFKKEVGLSPSDYLRSLKIK